MSGHPAQPDNLPADRAVQMLTEGAATLQTVASVLRTRMTRKVREELRRQLAGVVGKVEGVRYALKD